MQRFFWGIKSITPSRLWSRFARAISSSLFMRNEHNLDKKAEGSPVVNPAVRDCEEHIESLEAEDACMHARCRDDYPIAYIHEG
jgi:hypothetical protein